MVLITDGGDTIRQKSNYKEALRAAEEAEAPGLFHNHRAHRKQRRTGNRR